MRTDWSIELVLKEVQMLDLLQKYFKSAIIEKIQRAKETTCKEIKENVTHISLNIKY